MSLIISNGGLCSSMPCRPMSLHSVNAATPFYVSQPPLQVKYLEEWLPHHLSNCLAFHILLRNNCRFGWSHKQCREILCTFIQFSSVVTSHITHSMTKTRKLSLRQCVYRAVRHFVTCVHYYTFMVVILHDNTNSDAELFYSHTDLPCSFFYS